MGKVKIDSIELYYEEHGSGDPLLLIMGLAADSVAWMFQIPAFAERYRTIVFDNRGVGRSDKPPGPYSIHQMANDTAGLLDALGIERAHVVGVSMGGMIAQELALNHPQRVRGLVLACTYPEPDADVERQREFSLKQFRGSISTTGEMQIDVSAIDPLHFFQHLLPTVFNQEFIDRDLRRRPAVWLQPGGDHGSGGGGNEPQGHRSAAPDRVVDSGHHRRRRSPDFAGELRRPRPVHPGRQAGEDSRRQSRLQLRDAGPLQPGGALLPRRRERLVGSPLKKQAA
jgi:pimeloyl-ACP methyl ester carboxylesterase